MNMSTEICILLRGIYFVLTCVFVGRLVAFVRDHLVIYWVSACMRRKAI